MKIDSNRKLAAAVGVSHTSIGRWRKEFKDAPKGYDLAEWEEFMNAHYLDSTGERMSPESRELYNEKLRVSIRLLKLKHEVMTGQRVPADSLDRWLFNTATRLRTMLYQFMETEAPPKLDGLNEAQIRIIMREFADLLMSTLQDMTDAYYREIDVAA